MFLVDHDQMIPTSSGILLVKDLHDVNHLYQHIEIVMIDLPDYETYVTEDTIDKQFKSEVRKAEGIVRTSGGDPDAIYLKQREKYRVVKSQGFVPPDQIMEQRILPLLEYLINHGIDLHINTTKETHHYLLTGIYYHEIRYTTKSERGWKRQQIQHPPRCALLRNFDTAPWRSQIKLGATKLSIRPTRGNSQFSTYLAEPTLYRLMQLKSRKLQRPKLMGYTESTQKPRVYLGHHLEQPIHLPDRLALIASPDEVVKFTSVLFDQTTVKIGGLKPAHYVSIGDISTGFDLLSFFYEHPSVYTPLLGLIEEIYNIRDFAQTMRMFYDMMEESLSPEEREDFTISRIYKMLKEVPLASFEIPIDQKTKITLLQFFLQFPYLKRFEETGSVSELPRHLYLPTSRATSKHDLVLLLTYLHYLYRDGLAIDTIIIDDPAIQYLIHKDLVLPNLEVLHQSQLIFTDSYPDRKSLLNYPKLILFPNETTQRVINRYEGIISAQQNLCYWISPDQYVYGINLSSEFYVSFQNSPPLTELGEEEFIEFDQAESKVEEEAIETDDTTNINTDASSISSSTSLTDSSEKTQSTFVNSYTSLKPTGVSQPDTIDGFIDQLEKEAQPDGKSEKEYEDPVKENAVSQSGSATPEQEDPNPIATPDDMDAREEKVSTTTDENPVSSPSARTEEQDSGKDNSDPSQEGSKGVEILERIFKIRAMVKNKTLQVVPQYSQTILETIEQGTNIFGILSRSYYASTTKINGDALADQEEALLQFCSSKQLIQLETGNTFFITDKGKDLLVSKIEYLRNLGITSDEIDLVIDTTDRILDDQKYFGMQTYARSRLHLLQVLGLRYYRAFKVVPPLILSITNYLDRVKNFRFEDPEEFVSIFDAKYIALVEQYRRDIVDNSSMVRDSYIDTDEKPVPTPFPEKQAPITIDLDQELTMADITLAGRGRLAKPQRLIETEDTQALDESLPDIDPDAPGYLPKTQKPRSKTEKPDEKPLVLKKYTPDPYEPVKALEVIDDIGSSFKQDQGEDIRLFTSDRDMQTRPLIYQPDDTFDPEIINSFPLDYLRINGRIINALKKVGIDTVHKFRFTQCVTDIPGIGKKSLEDIITYQKLLADPENLPGIGWLYLFDLHGQNELLDAGAPVSLQDLPTDIFFPYPENVEDIRKVVGQQKTPELMALHLCNHLLDTIYHLPAVESLSEAIHLLNTQQKEHFELLYNPEFATKTRRKSFRLDSIYRFQDLYTSSEDPQHLENTANMLMRQVEMIHVNSRIFEDSS